MELTATLERPSPLVPGYFLDRYELLCPIAEGGMASVWVARLQGKHGFEKLFAIKTILPQHAADARFQQMFLDEARLASKIEHTNVAQILDLGEQHDVLYIVMEWVDGESLSRLYRTLRHKQAKLPHEVLLRIVSDACGGLHAAHELAGPDGRPLNVVHRDVTPHNILVSSLGVARLIDFGIAKARDRLGEDTSAGLLKGKIHFMAPEQTTGGDVDRRADVFAVGALLYQLLAGRPAFEGKSQTQILQRLATKEPPAPLPPEVDAAIANVILRALEHDPNDRFQTAAELQAAIEAAMAKANLACTTAQVAQFTKEHLAEHARKRKEALALAISAAQERQRVRELLRPPVSEATMAGTAASSSGPLQALSSGTSPGTRSSSGVVPVGAAAEDVIPVDLEPPSQTKRTVAIALACVALGAVGAAAIVKATRRPPAAKVVVEQAPAASTVIVVAAPPPTTNGPPEASATEAPKEAAIVPVTTPGHAAHAHKKHRNYGF